MLTMMRNLLRSKWAGGLLFGLVILAMALWIDDPGAFLRGDLGNRAVKAGERGFSMAEFNTRMEQFLARERIEGGIVSPVEAVEQGAVDQLFAVETARTIQLGYAERIGAVSSVDAAVQEVRDNEVFADPVTGRFDSDTYRRVLRNYQLTPEQFEQDLRDNNTLEILAGAMTAAVRVPQVFADMQASYLGEARQVAWFTVDQSDAGQMPEATRQELEAYYNERLDAFTIPERRRFSMISLSADDFLHRVEIAPEDLRAIYEAQKEQRFSGPSSRRFIEVVTTNETSATVVFGRLAGGATLEELDDTGIASAQSRTALKSEIANEELAEALFAPGARPGAVLGPIERDGLFIVARLDEIIPGTPMPFESVSDIIREELVRDEATNRFQILGAELFDLIGAGLTLSGIAEETATPLFAYVPVTAQGRTADGKPIPGLIQTPDLLDTVFSARVGEVSDPIEGETRISLVEVSEILPPETPPFEEIEARVRASYDASRESDALASFARGLVEQIETGEITLNEAANGLGREVQRPERTISRANFDVGLPQTAVAPAFAADEGDVFTAPGPGPDQITIVRVDAIERPDASEVEVLTSLVESELRQSLDADITAAMEMEFREAIDFEANRAALETYKRSILDQQ